MSEPLLALLCSLLLLLLLQLLLARHCRLWLRPMPARLPHPCLR